MKLLYGNPRYVQLDHTVNSTLSQDALLSPFPVSLELMLVTI